MVTRKAGNGQKLQCDALDLLHRKLGNAIAHFHKAEGELVTPISGLSLFRRSRPSQTTFGIYEPGIAVIAQGRKEISFCGRPLKYDETRFLLTSIDVPLSACIIEAALKKPYLSLFLKLDMVEVRQVLVESELPIREAGRGDMLAVVTGPNTEELLCAFIRLIELLHTPEDIPIIGKLVRREIVYRILKSEQGYRLRQLALVGSNDQGVERAIEWLKKNFVKPYDLRQLANYAQMGISTFHHHFRKMTSMSPLQYQLMISRMGYLR